MEGKSQRLYYGWVIVAVSFFTLLMAMGVRYSFGIFYIAILKEYGWGRAETAGAFSLTMLVHALFCPVTGTLIDRLGPRKFFPLGSIFLIIGLVAASRITEIWHLYLFFGVLVAIGINTLSYSPHVSLVPKWFLRKRGLAIGLVSAGIGLGSMVIVPFTELIIDTFGWRFAFLCLAGLVLGIVFPITAIFMRRSPKEVGQNIDGADPGTGEPPTSQDRATRKDTPSSHLPDQWTLKAAVCTQAFWWVALVFFTNGFVVNTFLVHLAVHIVDLGFTELLAASLFAIVGLLGSMGGILWGSLSDRIGREKSFTLGNCAGILGFLFLMSMHDMSAPWRLYAFVILHGLGYGSVATVAGSTAGDLFPGNSLGRIIAMCSMIFGFGGALGPYVGGYFHDHTGSYAMTFLLLLIAILVGIFGIWMAAPRRRWA